jgi:site-specific DNA-cytosine methylase
MYYCSRGIKQWGEESLEVPRLKDERLNPDWVEWLMGYPISWTDGGSRMQRLQSLGNAVVPLIPEFLGKVVVDHYESPRTYKNAYEN